MAKKILIVEDDLGAQLLVKRILARIDPLVRVRCAPTAESAYRAINEAAGDHDPYDLVIADLGLPGSNGLVLRNLCAKNHPGLEFLFVSGVSYEDWFRQTASLRDGPPLLRKPVSEFQLRQYWEAKFSPTGELGS